MMLYERRVEPLSTQWRSFHWAGGAFDTARRSYTERVEGIICMPQHLILITLKGGAEYQEVEASCGHRFVGSDHPGTVSFVPAHCRRHLKLRAVASEWASVSIDPAVLEEDQPSATGSLDHAAFTNVSDEFLRAAVLELARLSNLDGGLDPLYCEVMSRSLASYLLHRYVRKPLLENGASALPRWKLRRICDYVEANLDRELRMSDLAQVAGVTPSYFHRAFRMTTGQTPLAFVNERRVRRAMELLEKQDVSVSETCVRVGFVSPAHFARVFRNATGMNPSRYRATQLEAGASNQGARREGASLRLPGN
jgi:AraC family transcriptional regulator